MCGFNQGFSSMTVNTSIASPGAPIQVVAQSQPRDPIAGIPFTSHAANPAVGGIQTTFATQVRSVPIALVELAGGKQNRQPR
jgi:hypothetical protein